MADQTPVEFVGGPLDGQQRVLPGDPDVYHAPMLGAVSQCGPDDRVPITDAVYRRRRVGGIAVRLPSGLFAMDFDIKASTRRLSP